jgi:hypothetical protein
MSKKYQLIHIRILLKQYNKLREIQENDGITISEQVRIAVSKYLRGIL